MAVINALNQLRISRRRAAPAGTPSLPQIMVAGPSGTGEAVASLLTHTCDIPLPGVNGVLRNHPDARFGLQRFVCSEESWCVSQEECLMSPARRGWRHGHRHGADVEVQAER